MISLTYHYTYYAYKKSLLTPEVRSDVMLQETISATEIKNFHEYIIHENCLYTQ